MSTAIQSGSTFDIKAFLKSLTQRPGVYQMLDARSKIIYIGKAKNLKKRVSSYFGKKNVASKQQVMVSHVHSIDVTITHTESEALLLESQMIKRYRPGTTSACVTTRATLISMSPPTRIFHGSVSTVGRRARRGVISAPIPVLVQYGKA